MKHHLICIEGLSVNPFTGFSARYIANGLVPQLKTENVIVTIGGWNGLKLPLKDLWETSEGKRIIVGHSLGGPKALEVAETFGCDHLITLDPRIPGLPSLSPFNALGSLEVKRRVGGKFTAANFCHAIGRGWFPGLEVKGAGNTIVGGSHVALPAHKTVVEYVRNLLGQ